MQLALSLTPRRTYAISRRRVRARVRRLAFLAFPRLTGFLVL
jgi:hypothetical protein